MTNRAVFSVFPVETKKDIERLLKPAIKGKCRIVASGDDYGGKDYFSKTLVNPTWVDLLDCLNEQIFTTKDYHHVFLEGRSHKLRKKSADSVPEYELLIGS